MTTRKDLMDEAVDALFVSGGVVLIALASKKLLGEKLTDASTLKDAVKLSVGVTASTMLMKYAQDKKWLPDDPFKTT